MLSILLMLSKLQRDVHQLIYVIGCTLMRVIGTASAKARPVPEKSFTIEKEFTLFGGTDSVLGELICQGAAGKPHAASSLRLYAMGCVQRPQDEFLLCALQKAGEVERVAHRRCRSSRCLHRSRRRLKRDRRSIVLGISESKCWAYTVLPCKANALMVF